MHIMYNIHSQEKYILYTVLTMSFKSVAAKIAKKQGVSKKEASAELAASTRKASAKAKRKNPKLKRVK